MSTIHLGGRALEIAPVPLGRLKRLIPAIGRAQLAIVGGVLDESLFDDVIAVISAGSGLSVAEVEALPGTLEEIAEALKAISTVCGLEPTEGDASAGEVMPVAASTGTSSTPGSSLPPAGHGTTSTDA